MQSVAAQVIIAIVPIVGIFIGGIVVFFYLLWRHHEVKLQIKTGTYIEPKRNFKALSLFCGLTLTSVGLILTLVFGILDHLSYTMLGGLLPFVIGISSLLFYKLNPEFHNGTKTNDKRAVNAQKRNEEAVFTPLNQGQDRKLPSADDGQAHSE